MTNTDKKTYRVAVIERALAYYEVEVEDARNAAENWQEGEFDGRDDEALDTEGPCSVRERQPGGAWRKIPQAQWRAETNPYSVLLLYPDDVNDSGCETYYAFVEAADPLDAVAVARRKASAVQEGIAIEPDDFQPLLVTQGHHTCEPWGNE